MQGGGDAGEVEDEGDGVDGHVKDAGREGEPCLLEAPEGAEGSADPDVVATFFGDGTGELADHEGGGERPDDEGR